MSPSIRNSPAERFPGLPAVIFALLTALLYAVPLIYRYLGMDADLPVIEARLSENFYKKSRKTEFTACNCIAIFFQKQNY